MATDLLTDAEEMEAAMEVPESTEPLTLQFAELEIRRRQLEEQLKSIKRQSDAVELRLLDQMAETGVTSCRVRVDVDGVECSLTLYLKREFFCNKKSEVDPDYFCEVLKRNGLGYLVKDGYSGASLKSKLAEWRNEGVEIPEELSALMNIHEPYVLRTRK